MTRRSHGLDSPLKKKEGKGGGLVPFPFALLVSPPSGEEKKTKRRGKSLCYYSLVSLALAGRKGEGKKREKRGRGRQRKRKKEKGRAFVLSFHLSTPPAQGERKGEKRSECRQVNEKRRKEEKGTPARHFFSHRGGKKREKDRTTPEGTSQKKKKRKKKPRRAGCYVLRYAEREKKGKTQ